MGNSDEQLNLHLKRMSLILGWMLIAVGGLWMCARLWVVFGWLLGTLSPFLIALVFAYIFNPIVNAVQRRLRLGRIGGIVVVALLLLLVLGVFLGVIVPLLYDQGVDLVKNIRESLPSLVKRVSSALGFHNPADMQARFEELLSESSARLKAAIGQKPGAMGQITSGGATAVGSVAKGIGAVFSGVFGVVATMALVLVIGFYCLAEFDAIPRLVRMLLPSKHEERTMQILRRLDEAVGGFLRGQLIAACIVAALSTVGLASIGLWKYALLIGVAAGVGNLIPYLGPVLGATPALLWAILSPAHATWGERLLYVGLVIGIFAIVQAVDGLFSQPRIVGKSSHLHPLAVMAALVIGSQFGITGMILAVPTASAVRVLMLELWWDRHVARKRVLREAGKEQTDACTPS